jgi:hypothetical protein
MKIIVEKPVIDTRLHLHLINQLAKELDMIDRWSDPKPVRENEKYYKISKLITT